MKKLVSDQNFGSYVYHHVFMQKKKEEEREKKKDVAYN
jgi:hypothetical protein